MSGVCAGVIVIIAPGCVAGIIRVKRGRRSMHLRDALASRRLDKPCLIRDISDMMRAGGSGISPDVRRVLVFAGEGCGLFLGASCFGCRVTCGLALSWWNI